MSGCNSKSASYSTSSPDEYMITQGHITNEGLDIRSGLFVFPKKINEPKNAEYKYYCKQGTLDNSYMIYLKDYYSDPLLYKQEKERLKDISCDVNIISKTVTNHIEYNEKLFEYPAYIAVYNTNMSFEYALTDDENSCVIYVYLKLCEGAEYISKEYLPIEFRETSMMDYDTKWQNQNIYYAKDNIGNNVYYLD